MALLFTESFDAGIHDKKALTWGAGNDVGSAYGKVNYGLWLGDNNASSNYVIELSPADATIIIGMYVKLVTAGGAFDILRVLDSNGANCCTVDVDASLFPRINNGLTTVLVTSSTALSATAWTFLEIKITIHDSTGSAYIYMDGTQTASGTGLDTQGGSVADWKRVQIGTDDAAFVDVMYIDDLYIADGTGTLNDVIGPCTVLPLTPNANGTYSDFVGTDGNSVDNYALVADALSGTFVYADTEGDKDSYNLSDISASWTGVKGVGVYAVSNSGAVGTKYLRPFVRTASTDYAGTSVLLTPTTRGIISTWDQNPNTASAWTASDINGLEAGIEVRDS